MGIEIDSLPVAISLDGSEIVPIVQGGTTKRTTTEAIAASQAAVTSINISGGTTGLTVSGGPITTSGTMTIGGQIALSTNVSGTLPVANGGTGATTLTSAGVLLGQGTNAVAATAPLTNGQLLVGQTGADPLPKTVTGDATVAASGAATVLSASTTFALSGVISATISADQNDWAPTGISSASTIRVDGGAASRNITGIAGGASGRVITLHNIGSPNNLVLVNDSSSSSASNRLAIASDATLLPSQSITLEYDATSARWRSLVSTITPGGAAAGTVISVAVSGGTTGLSTSGGPITTTGTITLSGTLAVANGGTALTAGTSGGVLAYTATGVLASSATLAANQLVVGGGAGAVPATLGSLGTTTTLLRGNAAGAPTWGALTSGDVTGALAYTPANKAGETFTGNITIDKAGPSLVLDADTGTPVSIYGVKNGSQRWLIELGDAAAESGANAGSDFRIHRYNDAGSYIDTPLYVSRATGVVLLNGYTPWHAGNDGSGSGLDADLLDGQSSAYYLAAASYTAADVLAKLLTVDGSGSGLDADLLDGIHASAFAPLSGATFTGNVVIDKGTPTLWLDADVGTPASIYGVKNGSQRWLIELGDAAAESGANAGTDFRIHRYNDAGSWIDTPFAITRAAGTVYINGTVFGASTVTDVRLGTEAYADLSTPGIDYKAPAGNAMTGIQTYSSSGNQLQRIYYKPVQKNIGGSWTTVSG